MKNEKIIKILVFTITIFALIATTTALFSTGGQGEYTFTSLHGEEVLIYGEGLYKHMSTEVAIQGLAQDVVTLLLAIPILVVAYYFATKGSLKGRLILTGALLYFFLTYLFYVAMAAFNQMYLVYTIILGASFYALILIVLSFELEKLKEYYQRKLPIKFIGGFLMLNAIIVAIQWVDSLLPFLLSDTIPEQVQHYTTLIVQGYDLAIFLPAGFLSGYLLFTKNIYGYFLAPVYLVFLSILMTALTAKIIGMTMIGLDVMPVIIVFPTILTLSVICTIIIFKNFSIKSHVY